MKKFLALFLLLSVALSCSDDSNLPGESFGDGPKIVGFGQAFTTVSYFADEGQVEQSYPVNLIGLGNGEVSSEPIVINYEIYTGGTPEDGLETTAEQGVEFEMPSTGTITIPAGGTFGMLPITVNTGNLDPDVPTQVVVKLTSATEGTVIAEQYQYMRIIFVGCLADLAGTYTVTITRESTGVVSTQLNEVVTQTGINQFRTSNTGTFLPNQAPDPTRQGFNFSVLCGEILVPSQGLFDNQYSNEVVGVPFISGPAVGLEGKVIDENTFMIRYKANAGGATGFITWNATYVRNN